MPKPKYVSFDLDEVIYFMKEGDFSFFDFNSDHGQGYAQVLTKEVGWLCIYNVSDNVIPEETVRRVLDVLEHWDECLKQAYDWLRFYDIGMDEWNPANEQWTQDYNIKKEWSSYRVEFGEKACQEPPDSEFSPRPQPKAGSDCFFIAFYAKYFGVDFSMKFLCEDRKLYKIETYII